MNAFQEGLIEQSAACGKKSAEARHNRDEGTARFHREHFQKCRNLSDDPTACQQAFTNAYNTESASYDRPYS